MSNTHLLARAYNLLAAIIIGDVPGEEIVKDAREWRVDHLAHMDKTLASIKKTGELDRRNREELDAWPSSAASAPGDGWRALTLQYHLRVFQTACKQLGVESAAMVSDGSSLPHFSRLLSRLLEILTTAQNCVETPPPPPAPHPYTFGRVPDLAEAGVNVQAIGRGKRPDAWDGWHPGVRAEFDRRPLAKQTMELVDLLEKQHGCKFPTPMAHNVLREFLVELTGYPHTGGPIPAPPVTGDKAHFVGVSGHPMSEAKQRAKALFDRIGVPWENQAQLDAAVIYFEQCRQEDLRTGRNREAEDMKLDNVPFAEAAEQLRNAEVIGRTVTGPPPKVPAHGAILDQLPEWVRPWVEHGVIPMPGSQEAVDAMLARVQAMQASKSRKECSPPEANYNAHWLRMKETLSPELFAMWQELPKWARPWIENRAIQSEALKPELERRRQLYPVENSALDLGETTEARQAELEDKPLALVRVTVLRQLLFRNFNIRLDEAETVTNELARLVDGWRMMDEQAGEAKLGMRQ